MVDRAPIIAEDHRNVGFVEGPGNANPWGREQGIPNAAYCDSGVSMVAYHNGYRWWPEGQFGEKGCAYCPSHIAVGATHGEVRYDHASRGDPADVLAGDLLFYDWNDNGVADHVERAVEDVGTAPNTHNIGYNTGSPEGVHEQWRSRRYLLCRLRPTHLWDGATPPPTPGPPPAPPPPAPPPAPGPSAPPWPGRLLRDVRPMMHGGDVATWQQRMRDRGWGITVDGWFGDQSRDICIAFQRDKHLEVDGVVGPATWACAWTCPVT